MLRAVRIHRAGSPDKPVLTAIVVAAALAGFWLVDFVAPVGSPVSVSKVDCRLFPEKSIAVLPFEDLIAKNRNCAGR